MPSDPGRPSPRAVKERLVNRSQELRAAWLADRAAPVDRGAKELLVDIARSGVFVEDGGARDLLRTEMAWWRRWFASERREFVDPGHLLPFSPSAGADYTEITPQALLRKLRNGDTIHRSVVRDGDFSSVKRKDLAEAFAAGKIVHSRFERCNFENAEFGPRQVIAGQGANLIYVEFVDCKWDRVRWPGARASSLAFRDADDVFDADFEGAAFADVLFERFGGLRFRLSRASFTECRFSEVVFEDGDFTGATFTWCKFDRVQFSGCDLSHTAFHGCNLSGTVFAGGSLKQALFSDCGLDRVELAEGNPVERRGSDKPYMDGADWDTSFDVPDSFGNPALITAQAREFAHLRVAESDDTVL